MKLRIVFLFSLLVSTFVVRSQNQPSSVQDNYAGILAVPSQPANIADNRHKLDINLVTTNYSLYNNYIALTGNSIGGWASSAPWTKYVGDTTRTVWQDPDFQDKYLYERIDDQNKSIHFYNEIMLPSFLYTIDEKNAVSFTWRARSILNIDGIGPELATAIYNDRRIDKTLLDALIKNPAIGIAQMNWMEYGLGYGRVIYDEHKHFAKIGGSLKLVSGLNAMYLQMEEFDYKLEVDINDTTSSGLPTGDLLTVPSTRVNYGRSKQYDPTSSGFLGWHFDSKLAPALDIGFVYEFRPSREKYKYDMDGEYDKWMNDKNKYKFKAGISITDIGALTFDKHDNSNDFIMDTSSLNLHTDININNVNDFDKQIVQTSDVAPGDKRTFTIWLPTALSIQADYNIWNGFYANLVAYIPLYDKNNPTKVHNIQSYSLAPRFEHKWVGVSVPLSYNGYGNTAVGLALRVGPVTIGTTDFIPYIGDVNIFGVDGYFSLKIPLFQKGKPDDRDEDKISDKNDDCPEIPGLLLYNGCPDIDNDGIPDIYDDCPSDSGIAEFKGCPDTDGDGIIDKYDECIDLPGILAFQGCPDSDGDSIIDPRDTCPNLWGLIVFHGCPDTDGDSIIDPEDLCPEHAGPLENHGCPDTDRDGIFDYLDECPENAGPRENNGCPWPDTDLDGVLDKDDRCPNNPGPVENYGCPYTDTDGDSILDKDDDCPNVPGVRENNGCPLIEEADQEIINTAFDNLEFLSGKAVIRNESFASLDELAVLLVKKEEWQLKLEGHTDNVGSERNNLILSKRRAEAVRDYLASKDVAPTRIRVEFYGETKPVASNDTPEGRQKNRRVEMEILFE